MTTVTATVEARRRMATPGHNPLQENFTSQPDEQLPTLPECFYCYESHNTTANPLKRHADEVNQIHHSCIQQWLNQSSCCPICDKAVKLKDFKLLTETTPTTEKTISICKNTIDTDRTPTTNIRNILYKIFFALFLLTVICVVIVVSVLI